MYKVAVFIVMIIVSSNAVGDELDYVSSEQKYNENALNNDVADSIETILNQQHKQHIDALCKKLITEHLEKFRWLSKLNSNEQVYLENKRRV